MHELDRRSMLKVVAALSLGPYAALADEKESTLHFVEAGTDRTGQPHKAATPRPPNRPTAARSPCGPTTGEVTAVSEPSTTLRHDMPMLRKCSVKSRVLR